MNMARNMASGRVILLVEDNPDDEELARLAFAQSNLANNLKVVRDGAEALDYLFASGPYVDRPSDQRPQVVLLDLKLPKIDGLEVLRQIRADARTKWLPVVILTSSDEEQEGENGFDYRRMYLTADYTLSEEFSGRARLEA